MPSFEKQTEENPKVVNFHRPGTRMRCQYCAPQINQVILTEFQYLRLIISSSVALERDLTALRQLNFKH